MIARRVPLRRSALLRRSLPPKRSVPVRKKRSRARRGPERNPEYLAWIRTLGCAVCRQPPGRAFPIEAAHTSVLGGRGMRQKTSDYSTIPLCSWHHRDAGDSYHHLGERQFATAHHLDLPELVQVLHRRYGRQVLTRLIPAQEDSYD